MLDFNTIFNYDNTSPTSLTYKVKLCKKWVVGKAAGSISKHGIKVNVEGKQYQVSNIVWEIHKGPIPDGYEVGFKDGDNSNCKIGNLLLLTHRQKQLRAKRPAGATGLVGVSERKGRFSAYLRIEGKKRYLGTYDTPEDAARAREAMIKFTGGLPDAKVQAGV